MKTILNNIIFLAIMLFSINQIFGNPGESNGGASLQQFAWMTKGIAKRNASLEWVYTDSKGDLYMISRSLSECSRVIRVEFLTNKEQCHFVQNYAQGFFYSVFAPYNSQIIDEGLIAMRREVPKELWEMASPPIDPEISNRILEKYAAKNTVNISQKHWTITIPLLLGDGSIEILSVSGNFEEFSIMKIERNVAEISGTIAPVPM